MTPRAAPLRWPVCVLVTNPASNHTLKVQNGATIDFTNCMVQVNTANWDAVEARDTSYIHSTNGVNCFTGDIHYGDVTPPKQETCTMLPDPEACTVNEVFVTPVGPADESSPPLVSEKVAGSDPFETVHVHPPPQLLDAESC